MFLKHQSWYSPSQRRFRCFKEEKVNKMSSFKLINPRRFVFEKHDQTSRFRLKHYNALRDFIGLDEIKIDDNQLWLQFNQLAAIQEKINTWISRNMLSELVRRRVVSAGMEWSINGCVWKTLEIDLHTGQLRQVLISSVRPVRNKKRTVQPGYVIIDLIKHFNDDLPVRYDPPNLNLVLVTRDEIADNVFASQHKKTAMFRGESRILPTSQDTRDPEDVW
jgi:hypothetical protein